MLSKISWSQYLTALLIIVTIYYLYVFIKYYAGDVNRPVGQRRQVEPEPAIDDAEENEDSQHIPQATAGTNDVYEQIGVLIESVKEHLAADSEKGVVNGYLVNELKQLIAKYPAIKASPYRPAINDLILAECAKYDLNILDENSVEELWD